MYYGNSPLYPDWGCRDDRSCVRMSLFSPSCRCYTQSCGCKPPMPPSCSVQNVRITNPCDPLESATVFLGVDEFGNLTICVRRDPMPIQPRRRC